MGRQLPAAGASLPPPPPRGILEALRWSGVPRRQAAWRIAPRPPFRLRLRLRRLRRLQGCFSPPAAGLESQIRAGPGARDAAEAGRRALARAGQLESAEAGRAGAGSVHSLWLGVAAAPYKDAAGWAGGAARHKGGSRVLRALCWLHKAASEPAPSGPNSGRPAARRLPAAAHLHRGPARASLWRPPAPPRPLPSCVSSGAICPLIMIHPHKPPPAPFNSGALANQWHSCSGRPQRGRGPAPSLEL